MRKSYGFALLMMLMSSLFVMGGQVSFAGDVFEVRGVFVDEKAENVTKARDNAMSNAQGIAFDILLKRLTLEDDHGLLPWVEPKDRAQYIRDFSVQGEKTSSDRYLGSFTFHFKEDSIRNLLKTRNIAFAETQSKPVLILPLYQNGTTQRLWEDNPWLNAWSDIGAYSGLVPPILPLGDLADLNSVSIRQAEEGDQGAILSLAQKYGANEAAVIQLNVVSRDGKGNANALDIVIHRFGSKYSERVTLLGFKSKAGESSQAFLDRAAISTLYRLEDEWKRDNLLQFGVVDVVPVNLIIDDLKEWIVVRKKLEEVAVIQRVELALLSRNAVQLNLHFIGKLDQLITSLRQVDLDLTLNRESWALINLKK